MKPWKLPNGTIKHEGNVTLYLPSKLDLSVWVFDQWYNLIGS